MRIVFESFGHTLIDRKLLRLEGHALDPRPAYRVMAKDFYRWEEELFDTEGSSGGRKWADLKESTIKYKMRKGYPLDILQRTGDLKRSLTSGHAKGSYAIFARSGFEMGTHIKYGVFHYEGTSKMPSRRPVMLNKENREEWAKIFQRWMIMTLQERQRYP
jgi:phage gpG-like protein